MKFSVICATAVLALGLVSCGGKDAEQVKALHKAEVKDYTAEQMETACEWALEYQEAQIADLQEQIDNIEEVVINSTADGVARTFISHAEAEGENDVKKSEAYKNNADKLKENKQKIEALQKDLEAKQKETSKALGFTDGE